MGNVVVNDASLQDVANAIREKNGLETKYKPAEMGQAIRDIPSGGGDLPPEALVITGNCIQRLAFNGWNWFIENYGDRITTKDIGDASYMFYLSDKLTNIPFDINMKNNIMLFASMFQNVKLKEITSINVNLINPTYYDTNLSYMFSNSQQIRYLDNVFKPEQLETLKTIKIASAYSTCRYNNLFSDCKSLRKIPEWLYKLRISEDSTAYPTTSSCLYYSMASTCNNLDEIKNLPVIRANSNQTSNMFNSTFTQDSRIKAMTFEINEGMPYVANWKSQTIDLSNGVGYNTSTFVFLNYNSGITADKEVSDAESYEALKNNPDWFTTKIGYSRYNHDSAVETINSLPDTSAYLASAGGTNTIKFKGQSGELTDGGAINTLTEEEIAVAAAKGWTVTLV